MIHQEAEAEDAAERADVAHGAEHHRERACPRLTHPKQQDAAEQGQRGLNQKAHVVDRERIGPPRERPGEDKTSGDRRRGCDQRRDGEVEPDGQVACLDR